MTAAVRLVTAAGAAWAAAWLATLSAGAAIPLALGAWAAVALCGVAALHPRGRSIAAVALLGATAAALTASLAASAWAGRAPEQLVTAAERGTRVTVIATIDALPGGPGQPLDLTVTEVGASAGPIQSGVPVIAFVDDVGGLEAGASARFTGSVVLAEPGDRAAFLVFPDEPPEALTDPPPLLDWAAGVRSGLREAVAGWEGSGAQLLPGLALGDTSAVTPALDEAMTASSLTHLTAVSGANCAIVVGAVLAGCAAAGLPRGVRVGAGLAALALFVVLVTPQPSVQRAAVMAGLVLLVGGTGRPTRGVAVLSLAALGLLCVDPWLARSYGLALSVLATLALLVLAGPLARKLERWLPAPLAAALAVPVAAQLACQPVLVLLDPTLATWGVLANLLAGPVAPVATVLGMIAALVLPLTPPIGSALVALAWLPSAWIGAVAETIAALPFARLPWAGGGAGLLLTLGASAALLLALFARRTRRLLLPLLAATCAIYLGVLAGTELPARLGRPPDWQVAQCDIGQGDAVLLRSAGATALVDTGADPAPLRACLADLGVHRLDLLVLTHFDLDHVGGADAVVGAAERVLAGPVGEPADAELLDRFAAAGANVEQVSRGDSGSLGGWSWQVLWPPERLGWVEPGNDASVTLLVEPTAACGGCLSVLLLGDLGAQAQRALLEATPVPPVDVVKVSHHGSADQEPRVYDAASAAIGLIGVGSDNDYGHPTGALLDMLADAGTTAVRSDLDGLALLERTAEGVAVWTALPRPP